MSLYYELAVIIGTSLVSPRFSVGGESYVLWLSLPSPPQASSEGMAVVLCVCVLAKSQTLAAAALNTETQGSWDLICSLEKVAFSRLAGLLLSYEAAKAGKFW